MKYPAEPSLLRNAGSKMVEEFQGEEKASLRLSVLAIFMSCLAFWLLIGNLISHWF